MRSNRHHRPHWSLLYPILLLTGGGLVLEYHLHLSPGGHRAILLLIIAGVYGLLGLWVKANTIALQDLDSEAYPKKRRDPAVYGTAEFPTQTQLDYRETTSFYRGISPDRQDR